MDRRSFWSGDLISKLLRASFLSNIKGAPYFLHNGYPTRELFFRLNKSASHHRSFSHQKLTRKTHHAKYERRFPTMRP